MTYNPPTAFLSILCFCLFPFPILFQGITSNSLSKKNLQILGNLSCALNDSQIIKSDPYILQVLQQCSSFPASQITAIQHKLEDIFGYVCTWKNLILCQYQ